MSGPIRLPHFFALQSAAPSILASRLGVVLAAAALVAGAATPLIPTAAAASAPATTFQPIAFVGTASFRGAGVSAINEAHGAQVAPASREADYHVATSSGAVPTSPADPPSNGTAPATPTIGFLGLNHFDQRTAGTGAYANTQFSLEPPDQALCVGNGFVLESVNTALRVDSPSGVPLTGVIALNQFLGLAPEINRVTGVRGDFTSDPKCLYDAGTQRWLLTLLQEDPAPSVRTHTEIAVSQTGDPTGTWNVYAIDTTDDGLAATPAHTGCPCFGDQPLVGLNADGFFVTTNEFSSATFSFNGAQVYAMSKAGLVSGAASLPKVVHFDAGAIPTPDAGGIWYSIQPANSPPNAPAGQGKLKNTEFFLSALQFGPAPLDNRIAVWSLTNTAALVSGNPAAVKLDVAVTGTETYGQPPVARQRPGPRPLGTLEGAPLAPLNTNDDRMNQVVYANGLLYGALNTVLGSGPTLRAGIAYFIVAPSIGGNRVSASVANQGYVSLSGSDLLFPSIAVNAAGKGVMTFTVTGPTTYPSAAYAKLDAVHGAGPVSIASAGAGPADGFTGYPALDPVDGGVERWGDHSAATVDESGAVWIATELISGGPRTLLANWATWVGAVAP